MGGNGGRVCPFTHGNQDPRFDGQTGRHSDGSNFLLTEGHVKWLHRAAASNGHNAAQETDDQMGGADCTDIAPTGTFDMAAGTGNAKFTATFSIR